MHQLWDTVPDSSFVGAWRMRTLFFTVPYNGEASEARWVSDRYPKSDACLTVRQRKRTSPSSCLTSRSKPVYVLVQVIKVVRSHPAITAVDWDMAGNAVEVGVIDGEGAIASNAEPPCHQMSARRGVFSLCRCIEVFRCNRTLGFSVMTIVVLPIKVRCAKLLAVQRLIAYNLVLFRSLKPKIFVNDSIERYGITHE